jgi:hypothetical protein
LQQRQRNDLSRSVTALDMDTALIAVVEMSLSSGLVAGIVPGREQMTLMRIFEGLRGRGCLPRRCTQPRNGSPNSSPRLVGGTITSRGKAMSLPWHGLAAFRAKDRRVRHSIERVEVAKNHGIYDMR